MTRRGVAAAGLFIGTALVAGAAYVYGGWLRGLGPLPKQGPERVAGVYVAVGAVVVLGWAWWRLKGVRLRRRLPAALALAAAWVALTPLPYAVRWAALWHEVRSLPLPTPDHRGPGDRVDVVRFDDVADYRAGFQSNVPFRDSDRLLREGLARDGWTLRTPPPPKPFVGPRQRVRRGYLLTTPWYGLYQQRRYVFTRGRERLHVKFWGRADGGTTMELAKVDVRSARIESLLRGFR